MPLFCKIVRVSLFDKLSDCCSMWIEDRINVVHMVNISLFIFVISVM